MGVTTPVRKRIRQATSREQYPELSDREREMLEAVASGVVDKHDRSVFDGLTPHEKDLVFKWLLDVLDGADRSTIEDFVWEYDFETKPVDVRTFIEDENYFGSVAGEIDEKWKRDIETIFAPGSQIFEWILGGAIGVGKSSLACIALSYLIYKMSCLKNPARYYGLLSEAETIAFSVYAPTRSLAERVAFSKLRNYIDGSPYFRTRFKRNQQLNTTLDWTRTGKKLKVHSGSQDIHALGEDLLGSIVDEANFMHDTGKSATDSQGQAKGLYNNIRERIESRFMTQGRRIPGLLMLVSSKKSQTSFTEERKEHYDPKTMLISEYARWDIHDFSKSKTFRVEVGDRTRKSRILKQNEKAVEGAHVVDVPEDFRPNFQQDTEQALRDIAGVATHGVSSLIKDRQSVFDAVSDRLTNPFTADHITLSLEDDTGLEDYLDLNAVCRIKNSRWVPRYHPNAPRFIHADLSYSGDCLGFAMGHVGSYRRIEKPREDGTSSYEQTPVIWIDLMIRVWPPEGDSEIDLSKIHQFINYLRRIFSIDKVTCDSFQSRYLLQLLKKQRVNADFLSMDTNHDPYVDLRNAHVQRHIVMPRYEPYIEEVLDLEHDLDKRKVDHPEKASVGGPGRKDVADAVCGVVYNCLEAEQASEPIVESDSTGTEPTQEQGAESRFRDFARARKGTRKAK